MKRDIVLLYTAKSASDFAYKDIFDEAASRGIIRAVYTITDPKEVPMDWNGRVGRINEHLIQKEIPDFTSRHFYLSGPNAMVETYEKLLKKLGVRDNHIKKDYFPGFA